MIDAAVRFVAQAPSRLNLVPLEDALGSLNQPNMPGTIDEHPNWRFRQRTEVSKLLRGRRVRQRLASVADARP